MIFRKYINKRTVYIYDILPFSIGKWVLFEYNLVLCLFKEVNPFYPLTVLMVCCCCHSATVAFVLCFGFGFLSLVLTQILLVLKPP